MSKEYGDKKGWNSLTVAIVMLVSLLLIIILATQNIERHISLYNRQS